MTSPPPFEMTLRYSSTMRKDLLQADGVRCDETMHLDATRYRMWIYDFELLDCRWLGADSGFLSLGYQYCRWHFSQASSMPLPTSKSLSLSFASMALNASIAASCKPWAYLIHAIRSLLIRSSICSGASSTFGSSAFSPAFAT